MERVVFEIRGTDYLQVIPLHHLRTVFYFPNQDIGQAINLALRARLLRVRLNNKTKNEYKKAS